MIIDNDWLARHPEYQRRQQQILTEQLERTLDEIFEDKSLAPSRPGYEFADLLAREVGNPESVARYHQPEFDFGHLGLRALRMRERAERAWEEMTASQRKQEQERTNVTAVRWILGFCLLLCFSPLWLWLFGQHWGP